MKLLIDSQLSIGNLPTENVGATKNVIPAGGFDVHRSDPPCENGQLPQNGKVPQNGDASKNGQAPKNDQMHESDYPTTSSPKGLSDPPAEFSPKAGVPPADTSEDLSKDTTPQQTTSDGASGRLSQNPTEPVMREAPSCGYQMVEAIVSDAHQIGRYEASRLIAIAELYNSDYMRPHPASPAAHALANKTGRLVRDLEREDTTRAELVACLYLRDHDARCLVRTALALTTRFPATLQALSEGRLDLTRAQIIAEVATPMVDHQFQLALSTGVSPAEAEQVAAGIAGELEKHILKRAATQGPGNLRDCLHRAVTRLDPEYADRTTKNNLASRQVTCRTHRGDGTADLYAHLGAAEAQGIYNVLDSYARTARYGGSSRSLSELRADTLTHLILNGHLPDGSPLPRTTATPCDSCSTDKVATHETPAKEVPTDVGAADSDVAEQDVTNRRAAEEGNAAQEIADECIADHGIAGQRTTFEDNLNETACDIITVVPQVDPNTGDIRRDPNDPNCPHAPDRLRFFAPAHQPDPKFPPNAKFPSAATGTRTADADADADAENDQTIRKNEGRDRARDRDTHSDESGHDAEKLDNRDQGHRDGHWQENAHEKDENEHEDGHDDENWHEDEHEDIDGHQEGKKEPPLCTGDQHSRSRLRTHVQITIGIGTLLGLDDEPADLAGHGPVTAATARDLAFSLGSTWRRLVIDPVTGYLLDYGRTTYAAPAALRDHVRARDVTCRTPNCLRPASKCDLDHLISWPAGATSDQNLECKCEIHHRLKHEGRWHHQLSTDPKHPPGTVVIISPTGHVYLSFPHDYADPWPEKSALKTNARRHLLGLPDADPGPPPF